MRQTSFAAVDVVPILGRHHVPFCAALHLQQQTADRVTGCLERLTFSHALHFAQLCCCSFDAQWILVLSE